MTGFPRITHPGPAAAARWTAVPTRAEPVTINLAAGIPLDRAICEAVGWGASAWLTLKDAPVETLSYVIPAPSDGIHAAWYSAQRSVGKGHISRAGLFLGRNGTAPYLHCHGLWIEARHEAMGHLLCDRTVLAAPAIAKGWLFPDAEFAREPDPETRFELFTPRAIQPAPANGLLVRLRPNTEICATLAEICRMHQADSARVHGIGSLVGARFADGGSLASYATEFLIRDGHVESGRTDLDIVIVGMDGTYRQGPLAQGMNGICVTAEIFVEVTT